jgi:hypothetical protein
MTRAPMTRATTTKATVELTGAAKQRYLRGLMERERELSAEGAARLADLGAAEIVSLRVSATKARPRRRPGIEIQPAKPAVDEPAAAVAEAPIKTEHQPAPPPAPAAAFDPYAFNTINLYKKSGRQALADRLAQIETAAHLRRIAEAQRISLPSDLRTGDTAPERLREAIVAGVEAFIANRRAAAS